MEIFVYLGPMIIAVSIAITLIRIIMSKRMHFATQVRVIPAFQVMQTATDCTACVKDPSHKLIRTTAEDLAQSLGIPQYNRGFCCDHCRATRTATEDVHHCNTCGRDVCKPCYGAIQSLTGNGTGNPLPSPSGPVMQAATCQQELRNEAVQPPKGRSQIPQCQQGSAHSFEATTAQNLALSSGIADYEAGFSCDSCKATHVASVPLFHCSTCKIDICTACRQGAATSLPPSNPGPGSFLSTPESQPGGDIDKVRACLGNPLHRFPATTAQAFARESGNYGYELGFSCDKCSSKSEAAMPMFHCAFCSLDFCSECVAQQKQSPSVGGLGAAVYTNPATMTSAGAANPMPTSMTSSATPTLMQPHVQLTMMAAQQVLPGTLPVASMIQTQATVSPQYSQQPHLKPISSPGLPNLSSVSPVQTMFGQPLLEPMPNPSVSGSQPMNSNASPVFQVPTSSTFSASVGNNPGAGLNTPPNVIACMQRHFESRIRVRAAQLTASNYAGYREGFRCKRCHQLGRLEDSFYHCQLCAIDICEACDADMRAGK